MASTDDLTPVEWHPIRQLLGEPGYDFALIVLHQPIHNPALFKDLWGAAKSKIAADGGANRIYDFSQQHTDFHDQLRDLDTIIGDLDSLTPTSRAHFSRTNIIHETEQYSTDFAKAVRHARREAPGRDLICMGGLGGRVDQALSQIHQLYTFQKSPTYEEGRVLLIADNSVSFLLKGGKTHHITVREPGLKVEGRNLTEYADPFAKYVGIIPVGEPARISTKGLEWDVEDWSTSFGERMSTSNHVLPETTVVEVRPTKDVLFTIALK